MKKSDGRKNANVPQTFEELRWINQSDIEKYIVDICRGRYVWNLFSGTSKIGDVRVDCKNFDNVTLVMDVFHLLESMEPESVDGIIYDPPFVLYQAPGRNYSVWEDAIKKDELPESIKESKFFGHNQEWQGAMMEKIKPGGFLIGKRNITNCNLLPPHPQMWYVHDSRPSAMIVRLDRK